MHSALIFALAMAFWARYHDGLGMTNKKVRKANHRYKGEVLASTKVQCIEIPMITKPWPNKRTIEMTA